MSEPDLEACAREPIHVPGSIQPHGVLLGIDPATGTIVRASANGAAHLGRTLADVLDAVPDELAAGDPLALRLATGEAVEGVASTTGGLQVLELEPVAPGDEGFDTSYLRIRGLLQRLQGAGSLEELAAVTATEVRRLTGFDRVMVYRFDPGWNGEVIAEDRREDLEPFLGLWYPASDIPAQARDLYAATWLRLIADVDYVPVPIEPSATGLDGEPLDLGGTVLRSVSPVHLEYLRNMGVASSMSISLKEHGKLWGLIACHHYAGAHRPPYRVRAVGELVGQLVSTLLPSTAESASLEQALVVRSHRGALADAMAAGRTDPFGVLEANATHLLGLTGAAGAVISVGGRILAVGSVPPVDVAARVVAAVGERVAVESVAELDPSLTDWKDVASGVLVVPVGAGVGWVAWFRPELLQEVSWGGDPRNKVVVDGARISPRLSFEAWTEVVRLRSTAWSAAEVEGAAWLGRHLADVLLREVQARAEVADTLQRTLLLEALPSVPGAALAARYRPGDGGGLGGDWYDVFWLPGGRVVVAVGDVAGHGIGVAPAMAQLRHGLRAYLLKEASPGEALGRLNDLVGHLLPDDMASVVVADLEPATGRLRVANAGHLPPVLTGPEGSRLVSEGRGPVLGIAADRRYGHVELDLTEGSTLLLFTDGLVEVRGEGLDVSLDRLVGSVAGLHADLDVAVDEVMDLVRTDDDVTLLALRRS